MEKIVEIRDYMGSVARNSVEGFEVVTTSQTIKLFIQNDRRCCEEWGYFWCNDNPQNFIGTELRDVTLTDTALNEAQMKEGSRYPNSPRFEGNVMFVNLETDRGTLQFVAYNEHNGHYGHAAEVQCTQLNHAETL